MYLARENKIINRGSDVHVYPLVTYFNLLADDVKKIFSLQTLVMLFSTMGIIFAVAEFVLTQDMERKNFLGYLAYLPTIMVQYYMVCYYGQQIINKSLEVAEAAYHQTWYNGCQSYKILILTILRRSQRQCEINAAGVVTTNLRSFEWVMRMTYQLFAIWSTMMDSTN
ncbi:odorant receptor 85f-like isoform X2 [Musca autumnalis]|uniref:odorant receptor 85f-like isoform X2 n=1 Tax=Musca autumnalis TaxID=221902 RepID=UPI003CEDAB75